MNYDHAFTIPGTVYRCRCGLDTMTSTGVDCPAAMREEIVALRAQVEALKAAPANERASIVAFLRQWRDTLTQDRCRRQFTRAATDIENGAHHRV